MRALLDANVLIALLDAGHVHHDPATEWLGAHIELGWASCPLTQNGCIRILSEPAYPHPLPVGEVAARLLEAVRTPHHAFWGDTLNLLEPGVADWGNVLGSRQVTDVYLLALAVRNGGRLVTLDRMVPLRAVAGAEPRHLAVI